MHSLDPFQFANLKPLQTGSSLDTHPQKALVVGEVPSGKHTESIKEAIEIVYLPMKQGGFPWLRKGLPKGTHTKKQLGPSGSAGIRSEQKGAGCVMENRCKMQKAWWKYNYQSLVFAYNW